MKTSNVVIENSATKEDVKVDSGSLVDLMTRLGISMSENTVHKLLIWNDDHNDMLYVVICLSEVCGLTPEDCVVVMLEAHEKGKAIAKVGSFEELKDMKQNLNKKGIEATIEN